MYTTGSILIKQNSRLRDTSIKLSSSKSESNRSLIINCFTDNKSHLENISDARDTRILQQLLASDETELNVLDAGTTMRFLTAYFAVKKDYKILTGTPRMNERPIKILVDALREIGADINYINHEGYPPIEIKRFLSQKSNKIQVRGDISSQYITALLMVAPTLPHGLTLELTEPVNSLPYIEMTLSLMEEFGVKIEKPAHFTFHINHQNYKPISFSIESDWSGASYWYSFVALSQVGTLQLQGLKKESLQGDRIVAEIMTDIGVLSQFDSQGVMLLKGDNQKSLSYNFSQCPDLAQTVAVVCAAKGIICQMTGLESLRIKETDRIFALQNELAKIGARLEETSQGVWMLHPGDLSKISKQPITIKTYDDHRMAMAFAPLATLMDIIIDDPDVVQKSYPGFWNDVEKAGFSITKL
jgi:3-phosphoshikimate 1-carboxyvinyltransferase